MILAGKKKSHFCHWQFLNQIFQLLNSRAHRCVSYWSGTNALNSLEIY